MSGKGTYWVTDPSERLEIRRNPTIKIADTTPITIIDRFRETKEKHGSERALCLKSPGAKEWTVWTWQQYWDQCRSFAKSMIHFNVGAYKVINILGFNSPEWFIANTGSIMGACIAAGIYATNTSEACEYVSGHSRAEIIVVEGNKQLEKYAKMPVKDKLPHCKVVVVWGEVPNPDLKGQCGVPVLTWDEFMASGKDVTDEQVDNRLMSVLPGNCSTLIYTSGTTGPPKAVMISHDNVTWTSRIICDNYMDLNHKDRVISYLPLSHIAAQIIDLHVPMALGCATYFAGPDALKGTLKDTMVDVQPTFFFGVPRVWEKMQEAMVQMGRKNTGVIKMLGDWAKSMGAAHTQLSQFGEAGGAPCCFGLAEMLVLKKIKAALGLLECKACFTAAAPIAPSVLMYFGSLDIPVYEIFGQSECTGPHTVSAPGQWKIGTCGRPIPGSLTKIDEGTKELCYKGRHIFMGYMYDDEKTAETIDGNGFLHSGDVAEFDSDNDPRADPGGPGGFMKITGRIKELIITAGGENVPPVLIENSMKECMNAVSNVMVIGDKKKFLSMVLSLKTNPDPETGAPTDDLAKDALHAGAQIGSTATTVTEAAADPLWKKYFDDGMKAANKKTTSQAQVVQKWALLPVDFAEKTGELTPTLKLKRSVAAKKYEALIDGMYEGC